MAKNQSNIQQLIDQGKLEQALMALVELPSDLGWKDALELRLLRVLKRKKDAFELANTLLKVNKESQLSQGVLRYVALIFSEQGKLSDALKIYKKLYTKWTDKTSKADLSLEYGSALANNNDYDEAEKLLSLGREEKPSNANFHSQLGRLYCRTGRVEKGLASYQRAAFLEPKNFQHLQRLVYWSNYSDQYSQQSNFHLASLWARRAYPKHHTGSNTWRDANPDKPLKVGFVSGDFCAHAVSFFITPLLKNIDRENYRLYLYSDVSKPDQITKEIKSYADEWHDASGQSDKLLAAQMGADQLDVLIDLSGHSANNRMGVFSEHIAPLQINWLGYPSTTGLNSINYRITDHYADPLDDNTDLYFSEELLRLEKCFLTYQPHEKAPAVKALTSGSRKPIRFGSFNNLAKISSYTLNLWAQALHAVPKSTIYIKRQQLINDCAKDHLIHEFAKRGISEDRLILKTSKAKIEDHLNQYNLVDIALDTFPYNGTTTTFEALWMGTPVVTMRGKTHASRVSASILHNLKLDRLIADNDNDFIEIVTQLAKDKKQLISFSENLRSDMKKSPLLDHYDFTQQFEIAIRDKWKLWCKTRNAEQGIVEKAQYLGANKVVEAAL